MIFSTSYPLSARSLTSAIRGVARWLCFPRICPAIIETATRAIHELIRQGLLERDGSLIRRTE